ncbi:MAG: DNA-binding response regulator [Sulfobacillus acidophilus]|uniref:Stage 0 sporulation protein A homolog n=1 Tax=Sulfobacillus acidophilus TaxID=53633 RepID=A0A2T2WJP8_9FIRM|nr:MAG: DNA-binding response regulator [Sulfobacillus acidophilus]
MPPLKALIVEDEAPARMELRYLLEPYQSVIQIVGEATNVVEARALIAAINYDVVFLDVSMPGDSGMTLGMELKAERPQIQIVFVSAYEEHAIHAFSVHAVDYLLKPVSPGRMAETIRRLTATPDETSEPEEAPTILEWVPCDKDGHTVPVPVDEIVYIVAEQDTIFVATRETRFATRFTLGELESRLPEGFIRTHRSFIAQMRYVREIMPYFNGTYLLKMKDKAQSEVLVSRSNVRRIKDVFHLN